MHAIILEARSTPFGLWGSFFQEKGADRDVLSASSLARDVLSASSLALTASSLARDVLSALSPQPIRPIPYEMI